jgi:hypothetical protein
MSKVSQPESLQRAFCQDAAAGSRKVARVKESSAPGGAGPAQLLRIGPAGEPGAWN